MLFSLIISCLADISLLYILSYKKQYILYLFYDAGKVYMYLFNVMMNMIHYTNNYNTLSLTTATSQIDIYRDAAGHREIIIEDAVHLDYVAVVWSGQIDISCKLMHPHASADVRVICIGQSGSVIQSSVTVSLEASHTSADVYLLSLLADRADVTVHGNVNIASDIIQASGHLVEENIILGEKISVKTLPMLDVQSNDVRASHGCKIERIDPKRLFYMQSRGLDQQQSQGLILDGYINNFFASLQGKDNVDSESLAQEMKNALTQES